jgi:LuxR family maltose regulon positive regulatory protein
MGKVIEILVLQALAHQGRGETDEALIALQRALSIAEPEGYVRTFVDEGPPMASLLEAASERGVMPKYTRRLLATFETTNGRRPTTDQGPSASSVVDGGSSVVHRPPSTLVEALSERELQVLRLIAEGLSNRETAERLFLAPSTVKVHTRNIYGKLDVHSRTEAAARARELGLL